MSGDEKKKPSVLKKIVIAVVVIAVVGLGSLVGYLASLDTPRPQAAPGPEAEALADAMLEALDAPAWESTGAVRWTFAVSGMTHLWDRERQFAEVRFGSNVVIVDLNTREGVVVEGDTSKSEELVETAYARWANDSFWLAAPYKVRDPGTERAIVEVDGEKGLLVSYSSGGVTPGDAYLWLFDASGKPRAWRMWVSNLPVGGLEFGWGPFEKMGSGAQLASHHVGALGVDVELTGVEAAATLGELTGGEDPFAPLLK